MAGEVSSECLKKVFFGDPFHQEKGHCFLGSIKKYNINYTRERMYRGKNVLREVSGLHTYIVYKITNTFVTWKLRWCRGKNHTTITFIALLHCFPFICFNISLSDCLVH